MNTLELFKEFHETPIYFYPLHRRLVGRATTAILFAYILRQTNYHARQEVYNTDIEIRSATGLTPDELRGAKSDLTLLPFMKIRRAGHKGRTHYKIIQKELKVALNRLPAAVSGNPCIGKSPKQNGAVSGKALNTIRENNNNDTIPLKGASGTFGLNTAGEGQDKQANNTPPLKTSATFQKIFLRRWEEKYKMKYPFRGGKDGQAFKKLFTYFEGKSPAFKKVVERYLANDDPFYRGHPVGHLLAMLSKFLVDPDEMAEVENEGPDAPANVHSTVTEWKGTREELQKLLDGDDD